MKNRLLLFFVYFFILPVAENSVVASPLLQNIPPTGSTFDLHYQCLELTIDPAVKYIKGCITSYFNVRAGSDVLTFDLADNLQIDSIIYRGSHQTYVHTDDLLRIPIPIINAVQEDSVKIYYQGVPSTGFHFTYQKYWDNTSNYYTDISRPLAFSDSEPYDSHGWWPCKQSLNDKIDSIDFFITTPSSYKAAANGVLQSETDQGMFNTYHWKHRYPIATYLIACAISDYAIYTDHVPLSNGRNVPMINYVFPAKEQEAKDTTAKLIAAIQLLDSLLGPYPFEKEKFGHAQALTGMENQTMSFVSYFGMGLLTHELTHQWFGDQVTCGSWHDLWLNEGFATYMPMVIQEAGIETGTSNLSMRSQLIQIIVPNNPVSVYKQDTSYFGGYGPYYKGAIVLHMLRNQIGTDAFFQGLRNYLSDAEMSYGFGTIEKLQQHLEGASGQSLDTFFSEWYYGDGYPVYNLSWNQATDHTVYLHLPQIQETNIPFFHDVPLQLTFYNADHSLAYDTILYVIQHHEYMALNIPFVVSDIEFDRHKNILGQYFTTLDYTLQLASVTMSSTASNPTASNPIPMTVTFTESMIDFDASDLVLSGATVHNLQGTGTTYTFELIPFLTGELSIVIPGNTAVSINGNKNATASFHINYTGEVTGTKKAITSSGINVYPVPASSSLTVTAENQTIEQYSLIDAMGQQVLNQNSNMQTVHLDISTLKPGTYILLVWTSNYEMHKKIWIKK
jgi:hypothetical protein